MRCLMPSAKLCIPCGKERNKASARRYFEQDPEGIKQRIQERWANLPKEEKLAKTRVQFLRRNYKMTQEMYDEELAEQEDVCDICKHPETHKYQGVIVHMAVDHDHSCCPGNITCGECRRGILCHDCNSGIGYFNDDITLLYAAIEYLEKWQLKKKEPLQGDD